MTSFPAASRQNAFGSASGTPAGGPTEALRVSWLHPLGLIGLSVYNFFMRLLTLGIYHFWGKTEVRRRIWSAIRLNGEPLEYTGTGRELFMGFIVIFFMILLPTMLVSFAAVFLFGPDSGALKVFQLLLYAGFLMLTGIAIYRAQRFRLSRTRWRGIRAGLDGNSLSYGWTHFWTLLTLPLTLGWSAPWRSTKLQRIITNDMRFGTRPFRFSASSKPLYPTFALYWVTMLLLICGASFIITSGAIELMPVAGDGDGTPRPPPDPAKIAAFALMFYGVLFIGGLLYMMLSAWYRAAMMRHFARHTHLDGLDFQSKVTARGLLWISVTNYLIVITGATIVTLLVGAAGYGIVQAIGPLGDLFQGEEVPGAGAKALATTLGLAIGFIFLLSTGLMLPVTQARTTRYLIRNLELSGGLDMASVAAGAEPTSKRGEGLAQAFDIDAL